MNNNIYKLTNDNGLIVEFISLGARINSVKIPINDSYIDIILGYDTVEECEKGDGYMGAICGRVANRISNGQFPLDGKQIQLNRNIKPNHLHGGEKGFHTKNWDVTEIAKDGYTSAYKLSILSWDGDENYPGNLQVEVVYALNNDNELLIELDAATDKKTIINLTSHPYFNLAGIGSSNILDHKLEINANHFTPMNEHMVPTGEMRKVVDTAMDFNNPVVLRECLVSDYEQIELVGGLDHNWIINKKAGELSFAARVTDSNSNRSVEVYTTQPGIQAYTAMHFDGTETGKGKIPIQAYAGIALEAQNFPDAPNNSNFPSIELDAGEKYRQTIIYKFKFEKYFDL